MSSLQLNQMKQIIKWMFEPEWQIINVNSLGNRKSMARLVSEFFPCRSDFVKREDPTIVLFPSNRIDTACNAEVNQEFSMGCRLNFFLF